MSDSIIKKVKKLLSLANSANENEAKLAAAKANELLIKHNLNLQSVNNTDLTYLRFDTKTEGLTFKAHHRLICSKILAQYFFVNPIMNKSWQGYNKNRMKKILFIGTAENCEIANYIFIFLSRLYPQLWKDYRTANNIHATHRISYYHGLSDGIAKTLEETKIRVENETGLILKEDAKLKEYVSKISRVSYRKTDRISSSALEDGYNDGLKVKLRKGIKEDSVNQGLFLN